MIATLGLLEIKIFWNKGYDVIISVYDVPMKLYHVTHIILLMWSCEQSLETQHSCEKSYHNLYFIRIWMVILVQVQQFGNGLEILHQCGKSLGANS